MPKEFCFTPRLKLMLDHLEAVRELHKYVEEGGMEKDVSGLRNELRQDLDRHLLTPAGWEGLDLQKGTLYSRPRKKWGVVRGDYLFLEIYMAWPVGDYDSYVNLYVPAQWKRRKEFIAQLKPPRGFERVDKYSDGEWTEETSVFKCVRYEDHVSSGVFDGGAFIKAIQEAAASLVQIEGDIDRILGHLG